MKNSKWILVLALVSLFSIASFAQDYPKFEVPVGFSFVNVHPNPAPITSFNVFGGGGGFVYNVSPLVGIKADFKGYTQGTGLRDQLKKTASLWATSNGNLFTYMFGPQIKKHSGMFQPFGRGPVWRRAHQRRMPPSARIEGKLGSGSGNNNGFAMEFGGGLDIPIGKTIQFRPVEVDYLATHFGANHIANYSAWQNNFKYVAGVNFTFGGK